jgi:hypothetical protein
MTEFNVLGLSGSDGGSDEELGASKVEVIDEGTEVVVGLEAVAAARAAIRGQSMILRRTRCVELTCRATALPRLGGRHRSHDGSIYRLICNY